MGRSGECHDVETKKVDYFTDSGVDSQKMLDSENNGHKDTEMCTLTTLLVEDGFES